MKAEIKINKMIGDWVKWEIWRATDKNNTLGPPAQTRNLEKVRANLEIYEGQKQNRKHYLKLDFAKGNDEINEDFQF